MKARLRYLIAGVMVCTLLLCNLSAVVMAQPQNETQKNQTQRGQGQGNAKVVKSENIDVAQEFAAKQTTDKKIKAAHNYLKERGYEAKTGAGATLGKKETLRGKNEQGQDVEVVQTMKVQDYVKKNSKDSAAVAEVEISSQGQKRTYTFILEAQGGDINKVKEMKVSEEGKVQAANSFWSCVYRRCPCMANFYSCWNGSWTYYFSCIWRNCGLSCWTSASACCSCDCSWWCRWAVGCCDS